MWCAQTAAPDGEKIHTGESALGFSAAINAVHKSIHCSQQNGPNLPQKGSQIHPGRSQNHVKSRSGAPPRGNIHPRSAQDQPEGARERPKGSQEAPKSGQEAPQSAQEVPKRRPGCHQKPPKVRQASPRTHFLQKFREKFSAQRSWSDFSMFFGLRTMFAMWRKPRKPWQNHCFFMVFQGWPLLARCRFYIRKNVEK